MSAELNELESLGKEAMKEFFGINNGLIENMNNKQLKVMIQKAKLGFQFFKEINVMNRSIENNTLRFCTMIAENKDELRSMLKKSLPQYTIGK